MYGHIPTSSIYSLGRAAQQFNDSSPEINSHREQYVALEIQVRDKDHLTKQLKYLIRCAKRLNKFGTARKIERELIVEKYQLKILKIQRHSLFNRLTTKRAFKSQRSSSKFCSKTARLRALRLNQEALLAT